MNEKLTQENWQDVAKSAINDLPEDIRASIGFAKLDASHFVISVACEPLVEEDGESCVSKVEVTWWNTFRDRGWSERGEFGDQVYGPGGYMEEIVSKPYISVTSESTGEERGIHVGGMSDEDAALIGDTDADGLHSMIQVVILEELYSAGGMSMVGKDKKDRFVRCCDGSPILGWQFSQ